jgi:phage tail sheath gpL-like
MASTIISINHTSPFNLGVQGTSRRRNEAVNMVIGFVRGLVSGTFKGSAMTINAGTAATALASAAGTVTLATGASGTYTATINGVAINATYATSLSNTATLLAAAINASTNALVQYYVQAVATGPIVAIVALQPGITGNAITLAASASVGTATASGTRLTGGTGGSNVPVVVTL